MIRNGKSHKVTNFVKDVNNLEIIATILDIYLGSDSKVFENMKFVTNTEEEYNNNISQIKSIILDYGIKDDFDVQVFWKGNPIYNLLFAVHLFKLLPNYFPK